ncbi:MAG: GDSL-type esterase/lipase family protein [Planctomycetota bacterium]|jgi:lysophospholipase L1-like esterase
MTTRITFITAILLVFSGCVFSTNEPEENVVNTYDKRWGKEINAFKEWDAKNSVPDDAVLFVGSSSIRLWETVRSFPELKVINRGFGGSDIKSVTYFFDKIVSCYKPSKIIFYAGDNDIAEGLSPEAVYNDFKVFYQLCSDKLPEVEIIYISIKYSGRRIDFIPKMKKANSLIKNFCETKSNLLYVDLASCLLDEKGLPNDDVFVEDRLHLNEAGYRLWTDILKPILDR